MRFVFSLSSSLFSLSSASLFSSSASYRGRPRDSGKTLGIPVSSGRRESSICFSFPFTLWCIARSSRREGGGGKKKIRAFAMTARLWTSFKSSWLLSSLFPSSPPPPSPFHYYMAPFKECWTYPSTLAVSSFPSGRYFSYKDCFCTK